MVHHPLTDKGIVPFRQDWEKARAGSARRRCARCAARPERRRARTKPSRRPSSGSGRRPPARAEGAGSAEGRAASPGPTATPKAASARQGHGRRQGRGRAKSGSPARRRSGASAAADRIAPPLRQPAGRGPPDPLSGRRLGPGRRRHRRAADPAPLAAGRRGAAQPCSAPRSCWCSARPAVRGPDAAAWRLAILLGLVMAGMNALFYVALARIPLGVAVTLEFWGPLLVAVVGSRRPRDLRLGRPWPRSGSTCSPALASPRTTPSALQRPSAPAPAGPHSSSSAARLARAWPDGRGLSVSLATGSVVLVPLADRAVRAAALVEDPRGDPGGLAIAVLSSALPYTLELAALRRMARGAHTASCMSVEPADRRGVRVRAARPGAGGRGPRGHRAGGDRERRGQWSARQLRVAPGQLEAA